MGHAAQRWRNATDYNWAGRPKNFAGGHGAGDVATHMGKSLGRAAGIGVLGAAAGAGIYATAYLGISPLIALGALPVVTGGLALGLVAGPALARGTAKLAGRTALGLGRLGVTGSAGALNGIFQTGMQAERIFRTVMTGSPMNMLGGVLGQGKRTPLEHAIDAYLPNFRNMSHTDVRKFAPNPTIVKRLIAGRAVGAVFSGLSELINPAAPNPTIFYDGVNVRRKNDMGVHAGYGQELLGASTGMDRAALMRAAAHIL